MSIYKSFEEAKNGTKIPVFLSGRTMESRYNPQRDAENLFNTINSDSKFFVITGIGSGVFIELLNQKIPDAKIIAFEQTQEDINFLLQSDIVKKLNSNSLITLTDLSNLESVLTQNYLPAKYGNLQIIEQRGWINENQDKIVEINNLLKKTLGVISADYSVQAHFGKIWNSNILNNCKLAEQYSLYSFSDDNTAIINKTAVIIAAGPSLDRTLNILSDIKDREKYFIISTDTAGQTLLKKNIVPEVIVSIDGQSVSYNHFLHNKNNQPSGPSAGPSAPVYAFDLCANASAARHILEAGNKVMYFCSGHPLSSAINESNKNSLPFLFSGAGTVTITCVDLAVQSGFKNILILGADFSYHKGKSYASGTYLDTLYNQSSTKLKETEQTYSKLMFRTELQEVSKEIKTTHILDAYRMSLEKYLLSKNISFTKENDIYKLECKAPVTDLTKGLFTPAITNFSLKTFINKLKTLEPQDIEIILLPYIAWLRNNENYKNKTYEEFVKLALDSIVSYNI